VEVMANWNAHRVAVLDQKGEFADVISQTRLLRHITGMAAEAKPGPSLMGDLMLLPVARLVPLTHTLSSPLGARTIDAFVAMMDVRKSALAVIDGAGSQLVGNLSASDLKQCGYDLELFARLFDTVGEFLRKGQLEKGLLRPGQPGLMAPYFITTRSTVGETLDRFNALKVHRLYIVDDSMRPVGVVSPVDLFRLFSAEAHAQAPSIPF